MCSKVIEICTPFLRARAVAQECGKKESAGFKRAGSLCQSPVQKSPKAITSASSTKALHVTEMYTYCIQGLSQPHTEVIPLYKEFIHTHIPQGIWESKLYRSVNTHTYTH